MKTDRFKFMVWNQKDRKYLCEEYQSAVLNGDGSLSILDFTDGEISEMSDDAYYGDGNCIVEQCTGLRDRNGKLIYEGDVVRTVTGAIGIVTWEESGFIARCDDGRSNCAVWPTQEIIGNIHEKRGSN